MNYATLVEVRQYLGDATGENSGDDALLNSLIVGACKFVETYSGRSFEVKKAARLFNAPQHHTIMFTDDLLELTSITNGNATSVSLSDVLVEPARLYPKYAVSIKRSASQYWSPDGYGEREQVITLAGVWGYHTDYANAFIVSGDAVADGAGINASVTTINVTSASGVAADGQSPRFQAGQRLKIEDEYIDIVSISSNALTVIRGAGGSTAATHATASAISIYRPIENVKRAAIRLVVWCYRQKDANTFEKINVFGSTTSMTPGAVPPDVYDLLPPPLALGYPS